MFFAMVAIGKYVAMDMSSATKELRIPPLLQNSKIVRYDSVYNKAQKHFIIYDNMKAYPGYLITYTLSTLI